jgi:hypothetical protein
MVTMPPTKEVVPQVITPRGTDTHQTTTAATHYNGNGGQGASGETGITLLTDDERQLVIALDKLGVTIWVASTGGKEFIRPGGWQKLTPDRNHERLNSFIPGMALCINTGGAVVVVDVDPRNGGDIEKVHALLLKLNVRIFAKVKTPSGGRHFYIAGHPELPSVHSLPGYPGVDIQSFGCNVFVPGKDSARSRVRGCSRNSTTSRKRLTTNAMFPADRWKCVSK